MKNELRDTYVNYQLPRTTTSGRIDEKVTQAAHAKALKDTTLEERKKEADKPIYLVRYE